MGSWQNTSRKISMTGVENKTSVERNAVGYIFNSKIQEWKRVNMLESQEENILKVIIQYSDKQITDYNFSKL